MNRKLFALLSLLTIATFFVFDRSALADPSVTIRADMWSPFTAEPKSDHPGIMIDIAKAVFEPKGVKVDYELMPWARVLKEVGEGTYHGAAGASLEDAPDFLYTKEPQGMWTVACMVKADAKPFVVDSIEALNSKQVGAMLGYVYGNDAKGNDIDAYITAHRGKNVQQLAGDFPLKTAIEMLQKGRLDVILETPEVFYEAVDSMKLSQADFKVGAEMRPRSPVYIGFSPKNPDAKKYVKMLDDGMADLRTSGKLQQLLDKYHMKDWGTKH